MRIRYKILIFLIFILFILPHVFATTLRNTAITSNGLNSTINISIFEITFDKLEVLDNAITFYNLTYTNPSSCNLQQSSYSVYNYTISNTVTSLPYIVCSEEGTSQSGGGYLTYKPNQEQLSEGYEKSLRKNWKIQFSFNNEIYTLKVDDVINETAIITISSEKQIFNLTVNESKKLNLDKDDYYDLYIRLNSIDGDRVNLMIRLIHEEVFVEEKEVRKEKVEDIEEIELWLVVLWLTVLAVVAVLIIGYGKGKK
jgi:hypothetical protein